MVTFDIDEKAIIMNKLIVSAAILSVLTLFAHVFGGGPEIHVPVLESGLSPELKAILSVVWHAVTAVLVINSVAFFLAAKSNATEKMLVVFVSIQYLAFAALFIFYGITHLGTLVSMPQWSVFLLMPALALAGLRPRKIKQVEKPS